MKTILLLTLLLAMAGASFAQGGWTICNAPAFSNRVDDIFMVDTKTGYAVCGDGQIVKTVDEGNTWTVLLRDSAVYCRSVEFINIQKGFAGGFMVSTASTPKNVLRKTEDGGTTWSDLTQAIDPRARKGICGLAVADNNTIYGCGNWFGDSAYIIKTTDGGNTWSFINMGNYASSVIDMYFTNKDTGLVAGKDMNKKPVILYTIDGGLTWTVKFSYTENGYCWKIQHLNDQVYFASIETLIRSTPNIARSVDGGKTWNLINIASSAYYIEGTGFIDALHGWAGGEAGYCYETSNGGTSWFQVKVCPAMNRVLRVNDTLLFATGYNIWKYTRSATSPVLPDTPRYTTLKCYPNPVKGNLIVEVSLARATHLMLLLFDGTGRQVQVIENSDQQKGSYKYVINSAKLPAGTYYTVLKTHEDKRMQAVVVTH